MGLGTGLKNIHHKLESCPKFNARMASAERQVPHLPVLRKFLSKIQTAFRAVC
jgi:hypothetical protein